MQKNMPAVVGHTPGPWAAVRNGSFWQFNDASGNEIGDVCASLFLRTSGHGPVNAEDWATSEANVRLIVAAPDLLEALTLLLECRDAETGRSTMCRASYEAAEREARAAIAKVTGGAP